MVLSCVVVAVAAAVDVVGGDAVVSEDVGRAWGTSCILRNVFQLLHMPESAGEPTRCCARSLQIWVTREHVSPSQLMFLRNRWSSDNCRS